ncbi:Peptidyl-prolyl cis-trans isomerase FKBP42 [Dendrobium catenatum]|uniref:Peptidyl-prolyl cis-trans isomerase FKBP42 n=1 Tax=Dendrobium catenatum TaxID=906689 RepID=A0A2I0WRI0_9ASPA|nr:Peptidyl-prolyl cis-trans isomerase FKBP42 [Dendrobium catenatum]
MEKPISPPPQPLEEEDAVTTDTTPPTIGRGIGPDEIDDITTESTAFAHAEPSQDDSGPPKIDSEKEILHEKGKARSDMTVEERIGAADRRKMDGNALFKEEKLEEAMQQYEMAIAYMGDDFMFQLFGKFRDMALAVKNPCHLNMAACLIKLTRYEEAIGQCSIVQRLKKRLDPLLKFKMAQP